MCTSVRTVCSSVAVWLFFLLVPTVSSHVPGGLYPLERYKTWADPPSRCIELNQFYCAHTTERTTVGKCP